MLKINIQLFAEGDPTPTDTNYLEEIRLLKEQMATMVPGEDYDKVVKEHKRLTQEYINKRTPPKEEEPQVRTAVEIAKDLRKETNSKVDHVKLSLEYRDAYKKEQGKDPWVGGSVTEEQAQEVADGYKDLLDKYGDDPSEFTFRFDEALKDDPSVVQALKLKRKN